MTSFLERAALCGGEPSIPRDAGGPTDTLRSARRGLYIMELKYSPRCDIINFGIVVVSYRHAVIGAGDSAPPSPHN
ncbi:hypothetical protein EVAR_76332_1 [Eumeta japonica]|uniref:Uncharacterized protein n=1 Tax=Eumeta variegata TaxID=151549 RepID=A0A4C1T7H4_EUMVA|nr:hypothetical protein EVAR_76332_1 [Eumeta japonica]